MADDIEKFIASQKAKLVEERNKLEKLSPRSPKQERGIVSPEHTGLPLHDNNSERQKLYEERNKEYKEYLENSKKSSPKEESGESENFGLPLGSYQTEKNKLVQLRKQEYNQYLQQKDKAFLKPDTPEVGIVAKLGQHEEKRRQMQEERKREYQKLLAEKHSRSTGEFVGNDGAQYASTLLGIQDNVSAELSKQKQRNKEYNEFLNKLKTQSSNHLVRKPSPENNSLAALRDHPSAEAQKRIERNNQYNDFIKDIAAEIDHASANVDLSRQQSYPKPESVSSFNNKENYGSRLQTAQSIRSNTQSDSDSFKIDEATEPTRSKNDYLRERQASRRIPNGQTEWQQQNVYNDRPPLRQGWATPTYEEILAQKRQQESDYRSKQNEPPNLYPAGTIRLADVNYSSRPQAAPKSYQPEFDERQFRELDRQYEAKRVRFRTNPDPRSAPQLYHTEPSIPKWDSNNLENQRSSNYSIDYSNKGHPDSRTNATSKAPTRGLGANEVSRSADLRRKETYRKELEEQMKLLQDNKRREKNEELRTAATGALEIGHPRGTQPPSNLTQRTSYIPTQASLNKSNVADRNRGVSFEDDLLNQQQHLGLPPSNTGGILSNGFSSIYPNTPSLLNGLPSSYNSANDAYNYYASHNPLDLNTSLSSGQNKSSDFNLSSYPTNPTNLSSDNSQVNKQSPRNASLGFSLPSERVQEHSESRRNTQKTYQQELREQIEIQKKNKENQKLEKERYEKKLEEEIRNYNPFGRGGAGAPVKDKSGNVIANRKQIQQAASELHTLPKADLRNMHIENEDKYINPSLISSDKLDSINISPKIENTSVNDTSDPQLTSRKKYQEELKRQIEEKKNMEEAKKDREKKEEEKLLRKIEEEQRKMQAELEEERKKEIIKAEKLKSEQEELQRKQEAKRQEERQRRLADEEERSRQVREDQERQQQTKAAENTQRVDSPPVPAVRTATEYPQTDQIRSSSPPVPARRTASRQSRAQSADVLNQLSKMRQQLKVERQRVETDLNTLQNEPEIFDPRLATTAADSTPTQQVDVFEVARRKEPITVRRTPSTQPASKSSLGDFKKLKNRGNTSSRQAVRQLYPQTPTTSDTLELQQRALIEEQENALNNLKKKTPLVNKSTPKAFDLPLNPDTTIDPNTIPSSSLSAELLDSDSKLIGIGEYIPEDFTSRRSPLVPHNQYTPKTRYSPQSTSPKKDLFGSVTSLDPDIISKKNEDRLRKLRPTSGDDLSNVDPDDILEKFMAKQQHIRPPSGHTLQDESWLQA